MEASTELRALYMDPSETGVRWMLDPNSSTVLNGLAAADHRSADTPCDVDALIADVPDVLVLLRERHIGLATGTADSGGLDKWATAWTGRLEAERPATWGAALGTDLYQLRWLIGDNHLRAPGEDADLLRATDRRGCELVHGREAGPWLQEQNLDGVLCLRLRQCGGPSREAEQAMLQFQDDHARHFAHEKIIVDVRSNPGGSDEFVWKWIANHVPHPVRYVSDQAWRYDGRRLAAWNLTVEQIAIAGQDSISDLRRNNTPVPRPGAALALETDDETLAVGVSPWAGQMLVLTDRLTASAGESTAWMLREAFNAKLIGGPTGGFLTFGDITPYLLPRSGLVLGLATHRFGWRDVEMVGLRVDLTFDPRTPLPEIATSFDHLYAKACESSLG
ncbi:S41 family peptidase [Actinopolymorpha sp. B9G3]|uniref:S41 family peptidase n=1 Tax=Actinopolymorpha sp. B9G3 TaxID=3158970 RepID=UPI0032D9855B